LTSYFHPSPSGNLSVRSKSIGSMNWAVRCPLGTIKGLHNGNGTPSARCHAFWNAFWNARFHPAPLAIMSAVSSASEVNESVVEAGCQITG
jgi:hypothetical protein